MKSYYGQYPEIYSADDSRYTFFHDNGERITLIAGQDGVTTKWIRLLKLEHRKEYNMLRHSVLTEANHPATLLSLDQLTEKAGDESGLLIDFSAHVEADYIARMDRRDRQQQIHDVMSTLTDEQQILLRKVYIQKCKIRVVAKEEGVSPTAIMDRLRRIEKKFYKILD